MYADIGEVITGQKEAFWQQTTVFKSVGMSDIISLRSFYRHYQKGSSAGIVFTRSIFWFLALQGPHDAPINVKFGRDEGLWYSEFCWIVPGVWSCLPTPLCDNQLPLSFRRNQTNFCRAHDHSVACS